MDPIANVFEAAAILGIGTPSIEPLPDPLPGFVTLRVPEGMSFLALRDSPVGGDFLREEDRHYGEQTWAKEVPPAGTYRLRIPVPGSNSKTTAEQVATLPAGETLAPVVMVAAAVMCIRLRGGSDPLPYGFWIRCAEHTGGRHVLLTSSGGRIAVFEASSGSCCGSWWAASFKT